MAETSRIVLRLPAWMHERLKVEAFRRNTSMNELAVKILGAWFSTSTARRRCRRGCGRRQNGRSREAAWTMTSGCRWNGRSAPVLVPGRFLIQLFSRASAHSSGGYRCAQGCAARTSPPPPAHRRTAASARQPRLARAAGRALVPALPDRLASARGTTIWERRNPGRGA